MGESLEIHHLARAFGGTRALVDCNLSCTAGTVHSILGENGSGKSTLVKILSGVLSPDAGEIEVGGRALTSFAPRRSQELGIATVFQELLNVPSRSVLDNVLLGVDIGLAHRRSRRSRAERALSTLDRLGLGDVDLRAPLGRLPLSVQQQVAIARALQREPQVLVLDEATSALDVGAQERLFAVIREELGKGALVLFITHRMEEIMTLADRVTVLRNGSAVAVAVVEGAEIESDRLIALMSGDVAAGGLTRHG